MNQPYPRIPEIKYYRATSPSDAVNFLEKHKNQSRPFAGGTDCLIQIRDRRISPQYLIDLKGIQEMHQVTFDEKKGLTIGAVATLNEIIDNPNVRKHYPILVQSAEEVGGYQLRNRATLVGNLCNASPCGDAIGACLLYGAEMHVLGPAGNRKVALKDFYRGPGKTCLKPEEIVTEVFLPILPLNVKGTYMSIGRNKMGDLAIAAVSVLGYVEMNNPSGFTFLITLTAVAPTVIFARKAEKILQKEQITQSLIERAADVSSNECKPIDDIRGSANYRRDMIRMLTLKGLEETCAMLDIKL